MFRSKYLYNEINEQLLSNKCRLFGSKVKKVTSEVMISLIVITEGWIDSRFLFDKKWMTRLLFALIQMVESESIKRVEHNFSESSSSFFEKFITSVHTLMTNLRFQSRDFMAWFWMISNLSDFLN